MYNAEEFRQQLERLYPLWQAWLTRSCAAVRDSHADLMQQTAEHLMTYARARVEPATEQDWTNISFRILRRRLADHYRHEAGRWATSYPVEYIPNSDPNADPERVVHYLLILQKIVGLLSHVSESDRELLLRNVAGSRTDGAAMSEAERKRVSRLRNRLRDTIDGTDGMSQ